MTAMMMFLAALLGAAPLPAIAQPACVDLLEGMRQKVEANYAGYMLEVTGQREADYGRLLTDLRREAVGVGSEGDCFPVLKRFIAWFDDPHLFVFQSTQIDTAETHRRIAAIPTRRVTEAAARRSIESRGMTVDPIEGIWHDRGLRLAVVPDPTGAVGRFEAVVLASDTATMQPGMVVARFERNGDGYTGELRWRTLAVTRPPISLHRSGTLLRASPAMWSKAWPRPPGEPVPPDTADARSPTFGVADGVPVLAIPSHQFQYRSVLDSLLSERREALLAAEFLVVDLRGNEGGGSRMSDGLLPYILGEPEEDPDQVDGDPVMLSSPDQISFAKRAFGPDTTAFVRRLVNALEASPGELVPLFDPDQERSPAPDPEPLYGPRRAAILIDGGTVSASEVLVLKARRSARAVVIGESTAGALDYQSTFIVSIHPDERRWYLGYPTITAHGSLPRGGMRGTGIAPEHPLRWGTVSEPVRAAVEVLREIEDEAGTGLETGEPRSARKPPTVRPTRRAPGPPT